MAISSLFVFRFNSVFACAPLTVNGEIHHKFWISSKSLCTNISYILLMFYEASTSCYQFFVCFAVFCFSGVAWQLTLSRPEKQRETGGNQGQPNTNSQEGDLCILMFRSLITSDKAVIIHSSQCSI